PRYSRRLAMADTFFQQGGTRAREVVAEQSPSEPHHGCTREQSPRCVSEGWPVGRRSYILRQLPLEGDSLWGCCAAGNDCGKAVHSHPVAGAAFSHLQLGASQTLGSTLRRRSWSNCSVRLTTCCAIWRSRYCIRKRHKWRCTPELIYRSPHCAQTLGSIA